MTDAEQKAVELVNDARRRNFLPVLSSQTITGSVSFPALRYAIEDHERFRKEVSNAVEEYFDCEQNGSRSMLEVAETRLRRFIIAKPDPLVEAVKDILDDDSLDNAEELSEAIRAALAKRGGRIVFDD